MWSQEDAESYSQAFEAAAIELFALELEVARLEDLVDSLRSEEV